MGDLENEKRERNIDSFLILLRLLSQLTFWRWVAKRNDVSISKLHIITNLVMTSTSMR